MEVLEWSAFQSRIWNADNTTHFALMGLANSMFDTWFAMRAIQCDAAYRDPSARLVGPSPAGRAVRILASTYPPHDLDAARRTVPPIALS